MYVVLCQDAAIFYESKTAFLARTPHASRCQEKTFFFFPVPVYVQVKFKAFRRQKHEILFSSRALHTVGRRRRWEGRRQVVFPTADPRHFSFCSSAWKNQPGLCVPESPPTRGAHKLEGTWLICRQTGGKVLPWFSLAPIIHHPNADFFYTPNDDLERNNGFCLWSLMNEKSNRKVCCITTYGPHVGSLRF